MMHKVLETGRMVLRRMETPDVDNLMGIFSDPVAMSYYPATKSRQEAEEWVRWTLGSYRDHGFGQWVAILKSSGEFVGQCGLTVQEVEGEEEVEIGYLFLRRFWGRGLATEAARAVRDHGFALGYRRLISIMDPANLPSRRVAEKTGLTLEKEVWKWNKKVYVYAIRAVGDQPSAVSTFPADR
jgi:[ribosomal protein S5]-alanine N-acetyltransferase